jgi:hypothetical protein
MKESTSLGLSWKDELIVPSGSLISTPRAKELRLSSPAVWGITTSAPPTTAVEKRNVLKSIKQSSLRKFTQTAE